MTDQLSQLAKFTKIVADTGDIDSIKKFKPVDATTNPSLLLKAVQIPAYKALVDDAIAYGKKKGKTVKEQVSIAFDRMAVNFGTEITKIVPGVVSTEVDARLSFDTEGTVKKARQIIEMYKEKKIDKKRILIKVASTWEGIQAVKILEKEGITCNMTLLFAMAQAVAAAEAGATLISPFVGRIYDFYKKKTGKEYKGAEDPGVKSVTAIYKYYKAHGYKTIVMGASFRNTGQLLSLAGCDKLTISPKLLDALKAAKGPVKHVLKAEEKSKPPPKLTYDEKSYRYAMCDNEMATVKLAEGIRKFAADAIALEKIIEKRITG